MPRLPSANLRLDAETESRLMQPAQTRQMSADALTPPVTLGACKRRE